MLLQTMDAKDVMATMILQTPKAKYDKLSADYVALSSSMASSTRSRFNDFRMHNGDTVIQIQHRFDQVVSECIIQAQTVPEAEKMLVLLTHPTDKWMSFMDLRHSDP